jgi:hypothetical protein
MHSQALPRAALPFLKAQPSKTGKWATFLQRAVFFFLGLFVILLPHSVKGARHAWIVAFWVWLAALLIERKRPFNQPLALPLLAFIVFSAISTALSPDPYLSWGYMKLVCYTALIGTLFAQNLTRLSQVRFLIFLLLVSASAAAAFTAWQYTFGIGVRATAIDGNSELFVAGVRPGDAITKVDGRSVHTPQQLIDALHRAAPGTLIRVDFLRGAPTEEHSTAFKAGPGGFDTRWVQLARARPVRAQGTLRHYGIFAEVLMPMGCFAWVLFVGSLPHHRWRALIFGVIFLALTGTIFATQTRAALAGLLVGCLLTVLLLVRKRARIWTVTGLVLLAVFATLWIKHTRGLGWIARRDPGTQYRWLMWQDGMHLARTHPFFGVGMATVQNHWQEWNIRAFEMYHAYWNFHSDYVQIAAERGFLTLAAWLWFEIAYLVFLFRLLARARRQNQFATMIVVGVLSGFVAFLFPSLVESALNDDALVMLLFFSFGVALAIDRMLQQPDALDVN